MIDIILIIFAGIFLGIFLENFDDFSAGFVTDGLAGAGGERSEQIDVGGKQGKGYTYPSDLDHPEP